MTKITPEHLARNACVYIRQSTADQLTHTRMVHDAAAVRRRESYASTPAHASINSRQRPCRQLGAASIRSKRRYNDDAIVPRGAFEHPAAVLVWIKRP
jgi:hypothetical protein